MKLVKGRKLQKTLQGIAKHASKETENIVWFIT